MILTAIKKFKINCQTTPLFLLGRSYGGLLATHMINAFPGMFKGLILITPFYRSPNERFYKMMPVMRMVSWFNPYKLMKVEWEEYDKEYY
mmetsp:Transcript_5737/g.4096  ORF Transcript_5737/g.4096 Transcript_5737/m.4096 type:complete len:90 (+) Transcript_5737:521-790(+)